MARVRPIQIVPIDQIRKDPNNAYSHEDGDIQRLHGVIQEYGFLGTLAVDEDLVLIGGEARLEVLHQLAYDEVPINVVEGLDPEERKALAIALNANFGAWNDEVLRRQLFELKREHFDLDLTGLKPFEIERSLDLSKKNQLDMNQKGGEGQGDPVLSYRITFSSEIEQSAWWQFARYLKGRYPEHTTVGERITAYVAELGGFDGD